MQEEMQIDNEGQGRQRRMGCVCLILRLVVLAADKYMAQDGRTYAANQGSGRARQNKQARLRYI